MDIEKLIERLNAKDFERDFDCTPFECGVFALLDEAATALSTLQVENAQLRHRLSEAISACSRIAEWAQNTGHDHVEGIAREFLEGDG